MTRREFTVANEYRYNYRSPLRWMFSHIWRYPWLMILFLITMFAMVSSQSLSAVAVGNAFDVITNQSGTQALAFAALLVVAAYVGYGVFDFINSMAIRVLAQRVERDARDELYVSLLSKSQTFHGRQRVGDLMARVTNDVQLVNQFVSPALGMTIESLLTLIIPIITIANMNPELLLVPVVFLIVVSFALRHYNNELRPVAGQLRTRFGVMNAGLAETITGIEVVKGFAQEPTEEARFTSNARAYRDAFVREGEVTARYYPLLIYGITIGIAFGHALYLYTNGLVTMGEVITYMALISTLRTPMRFLLMSSSTLQQSIASAERILQMILTETELDQNSAGVSKKMEGDIVFENVSFSYGGDSESADNENKGYAIHSVSFHAKPGQTVAIVGQTGAGKSTLTRLINRTFDATEGRVLIDGIDVRDVRLADLRRNIAIVSQDPILFNDTIYNNLLFGRPDATREEIEQAAKAAFAHDFIVALPNGYDTLAGERGTQLSGGQKQRIALARAFLRQAPILILDEATSALDSESEAYIQQALKELMVGKTVLIIAHRFSTIRDASMILVFQDSRIVAHGSHETLYESNDLYRSLYDRQRSAA